MLMPPGRWELPASAMLEIGSGAGDSLLAAADRWDLVIGVEVHLRGLAATLRAARESGRGNIRLARADAVDVLREQVPPLSLAEIQIWFPDPWPKAKHHKRRLIRPSVAGLLAGRLAPGGVLRLATDVPEYAAVMQQVLLASGGLRPLGEAGVVERPPWRPVTRYEREGLAAGRTPTELAYRRE